MKRLIATAMTAAYVFGAAVGSGIANERVASAELLRTLVTVPLPGEPTNLALADGSLWMSVPAQAILLRIDARSGRRLARIRVTDQDWRAFGGGAVAALGGHILGGGPGHLAEES